MSEVSFMLNGKPVKVNADADTPLVWAIRDRFFLTGTKYGCGAGLCGVCTVRLNDRAVRACITPLAAVEGGAVTTIEGLSPDRTHPLQQAWEAEQVAQCGYCQSGMLMQASVLLDGIPSPSREAIVAAMDGNVCRCGTYQRIIRAIERASGSARAERPND